MLRTPNLRRLIGAVSVAAISLTAAACNGSDDDEAVVEGQLFVFAAASLKTPLTEIASSFEDAHDGVEVVLSFTGSNTAATQVIEGAPAGVLATANAASMQQAIDKGAVTEATTFATNSMAILVAPDNPSKIKTVADLANPDLTVVLCAPEVPCGSYADELLAAAEVDLKPKSFEANVNGVVTKVINREADAGLVYSTDVNAAGNLASGVEIPAEQNITAEYQIAAVGAEPSGAATEFVKLVTSSEGNEVLTKYGFGVP